MKSPVRPPPLAANDAAGRQILSVYEALARKGEHLFGPLVGNQPPEQWRHYPEDDAADATGRFQWFYHSHPPADRAPAIEHGHIHLFARREALGSLSTASDRAFNALVGNPRRRPATRHLLAVGFDAKGVPVSLFTVNGWVTGDLMLAADRTEALLVDLRLDTGHVHIDAVLAAICALCRGDISTLMSARDEALRRHPDRASVLETRDLEVLSEIPIDLDAKLAVTGAA